MGLTGEDRKGVTGITEVTVGKDWMTVLRSMVELWNQLQNTAMYILALQCFSVTATLLIIRDTRKIAAYGRLFLAPAEGCSLQLQWWGPPGPLICFLAERKFLWKKIF